MSLTAEKNVIVHDDANVKVTSQGIPCKISNFTNNAVTLENGIHIAWKKPLIKSFSVQVGSTLKKPPTENLSKIQHRNMVLNEIRQWFQIANVQAITIVKKENPIQYNVNDSMLPFQEKKQFYKLLEDNRNSFAVNDSELGTIDIIKCEINVENATPFRCQTHNKK